ncbi:MAG: 50S ribosomal protein L25/general stress protein Ctc [Alphaproteobacteria bacterium]
MADVSTLAAERRDRVGKGSARAARRNGRVPAVIYGAGQDPLPITLAFNEVLREVKRGRFMGTLFDVEIGSEKERVIPRDLQVDVVKDFPMHIDFLRISRDSRIDVEVPVHFINEETCVGLKRGGVLNIVRHDVELSCPADSIPEEIVLDIEALDIGDSVHIGDVDLPEGVTPTIADRDFTIATIAAPSGGTDEDEDEAVEGEEGAEEAEATEGEDEGGDEE